MDLIMRGMAGFVERIFGRGFSLTRGCGICQRSQAALKDSAVKLLSCCLGGYMVRKNGILVTCCLALSAGADGTYFYKLATLTVDPSGEMKVESFCAGDNVQHFRELPKCGHLGYGQPIFKPYNPVTGMYEYYITTPACRAQNPCSPSIPACPATRSRTIPSNLPWGKYLTIGDNHPSLAGISRKPKAPEIPPLLLRSTRS